MSTCRSCGAEIIWANHPKTGKRAPFDAEPAPDARWELVHRRDGAPLAHRVEAAQLDLHGNVELHLHHPHFKTCPHADEWRRSRG